MSPINVIALSATACVALFQGIVAFVRGPDRPSNRLFAVNSVWVCIWALLTCYIQVTDDVHTIKLLLRAVHFVSVMVLVTLIDFVWVFPEKLRFGPLKRRMALYVSGLLMGAVASSPALVRSVQSSPMGPAITFGWPLAVLGAYMAPLLAYCNWVLWRKAKTMRGIARVQIIYVLAGGVACEALIFFINVILPIITHTTAYSRWGVVSCLIYSTAIAVAIAKYRLWDLSELARGAAAAVLVVACIGLSAFGLAWLFVVLIPLHVVDPLGAITVWFVFGAIAGLGAEPLFRKLRGMLSRAGEIEAAKMSRLLSALGEAVVSKELPELPLLPVLAEAREFFDAAFMEAFLIAPDGAYRSAGRVVAGEETAVTSTEAFNHSLPDGVVQIIDTERLTTPLEAAQLMRFGPVGEVSEKLRALKSLQAEVIVPLRWHNRSLGLLVVGPKMSGHPYGPADLDLLKSIAAYAAVAVRNAELRAEILAETERTEKVLAEMESGVVVADTTGAIRLVNRAACSLLSQHRKTLFDHGISVLPEELRSLLRQALDGKGTVSNLIVHLDGGQRIPLACSTLVLRDSTGKLRGAGVVFRDLRTEEALRQAEQETRRLEMIRTISAGLAHQIRNPLVAIRTFAELAPTRLDDPEFRESFLEVAKAEVARIEALVSQFLNLARPTPAVRETVDIGQVIESTARSFSAQAEARRISMNVRIPPHRILLRGDASRLQEALANLLLNALEATPSGGRIELSAEILPPGLDEPPQVKITVWNSGSYILPEDRERIFEPFFTGKATGTGLGLAICHTIVGEHGGRIIVESDVNEGTAFIMRLPVLSSTTESAAMTTP